MSTPQPVARSDWRLPARTLGALSASAIAFPLMGSTAQAATTVPYPTPPVPLPSALDVAPPYQKGTMCLTYNQPGAVAFVKMLNATYGYRTWGILRHCAAEHGEGRALDWMINANDPSQLALANAITRWLAAPDSQGRAGAMAKRFGINYMIWNRQMWRAYDTARGWAPYYGVSPHTDHIHISFNWDGARMRSSWWSGVAVTTPLTGPNYTAPPPVPVITASGYPLLVQGATGPDVALAQKVIGVTADGKFGPITAAALGRGRRSTAFPPRGHWTTPRGRRWSRWSSSRAARPTRSRSTSTSCSSGDPPVRRSRRCRSTSAVSSSTGPTGPSPSHGSRPTSRPRA